MKEEPCWLCVAIVAVSILLAPYAYQFGEKLGEWQTAPTPAAYADEALRWPFTKECILQCETAGRLPFCLARCPNPTQGGYDIVMFQLERVDDNTVTLTRIGVTDYLPGGS